MDGAAWFALCLFVSPIFIGAWKTSAEERKQVQELRMSGVHYHTKRHMLPAEKRSAPPRRENLRKKPTGHLIPLQEDDIDNDEVVSVAIGPPPMRPKYDKWRPKVANVSMPNVPSIRDAASLVKDVLVTLGRDFVSRQVSEDFVFGQYVGNAMRNLSSDLKLKMQHDILELVVRYQKLNMGELLRDEIRNPTPNKDFKDRKTFSNDTEESWPDFTNLAKIVG